MQLFTACLVIGLTSFGGGLIAYVHQVFVLRKRWISEGAFLEVLELAQVMPGPNVVNLVSALAYRLKGLHAAILAFVGLIVPAITANCLLAAFVLNVDPNGVIGGALAGFGAAAIGLTLANTWLIGHGNLKNLPDLALAVVGFLTVLIFDLPLLVAVLVFGLIGIVLHARRSQFAEPGSA